MKMEVPIKPYYQDGHCTLYNADCRQVLPFLDKFDLLLTDPPYGIDIVTQFKKAEKSKSSMFNLSVSGPCSGEWDAKPVDDLILRICITSSKYCIVWGGNYFTNAFLAPSQKWLVWDKMNGTNPMADAELAWTNLSGSVRMFRIHHFSAGCERKSHPTQKPVPLMRWCLGLVPDAQTILDPFAGSGTTLVAAKLEGRKAVGIEIDEKYCEIAANRLRQKVLF